MSDVDSIDRISLERNDRIITNEIPLDKDSTTSTSIISPDHSIITNRKKIKGVLYGVGYNINHIIGAGIFNPDSIWILAQSPGIVLVLYVVCGIISFLGSSVYIELGIRSLPSGIGEQKYITDAFYPRKDVGHVFSFTAIFIILPGAIVAESYIFAQYLLYSFRGNLTDDRITVIASIATLFIITLYQMYSNRVSDTINQTLAFVKIILLLIISIIGIIKLETNSLNWNNIFNSSINFGAFGSGLIKVLFTYEGWNNINYLIGEFSPSPNNTEYPSIILRYSSHISIGISFLLYFLTNAAFITVVGYNVTDNGSTSIAIRFGKELFDGTGEKLMSILAAISAFGCTSAMIFTYSRIIKYAAETKFISERISPMFNHYNIKFDTLINQLLVQFLYCLILTIIFFIKKSYNVCDFFSNASQYTAMIFHGASAYCLYRLKERNLRNPDIFSLPITIIIIYLLIIIYIVGASFYPPNGKWVDIIPYCVSWAVIALGLIIWLFHNRKRSESTNGENITTVEPPQTGMHGGQVLYQY